MSALSTHAQAARILGEVWTDEFTSQTDDTLASIAGMLATGYLRAATKMEEAARAELVSHACTVNHATMQIPKCIACGAPRAKR